MATQIENQVFAHNAHQVVADHAHIVFRGVVTNISVNCRKALSNRTASFQGRLVHQQNTLVIRHPFFDLKGSAAGGHTAADDQNINFALLDFRVPYSIEFPSWFIR